VSALSYARCFVDRPSVAAATQGSAPAKAWKDSSGAAWLLGRAGRGAERIALYEDYDVVRRHIVVSPRVGGQKPVRLDARRSLKTVKAVSNRLLWAELHVHRYGPSRSPTRAQPHQRVDTQPAASGGEICAAAPCKVPGVQDHVRAESEAPPAASTEMFLRTKPWIPPEPSNVGSAPACSEPAERCFGSQPLRTCPTYTRHAHWHAALPVRGGVRQRKAAATSTREGADQNKRVVYKDMQHIWPRHSDF
jgi:hypothetical protein